jgi:translocation and assembly module TamB
MPAPEATKSFKNKFLSILWRIAKVACYASGGLLLLLIFAVLLLQTAFVQQKITQRTVDYVAQKTGAAIQLEAVRFDFDGAVHIQNLFVPDVNGDTLLISKDLKVKIPLLPLLDQKIIVQQFQWQGVLAAVAFDDSGSSNFDYLINAFQSETGDTTIAADTTNQAPWTFEIGNLILRDFDL